MISGCFFSENQGYPTRTAGWGKEEPRYEVKAYLPDTPSEYSKRRRAEGGQVILKSI